MCVEKISRTSEMVPKRLWELVEGDGGARALVSLSPTQPVWQGASVWRAPATWPAVPQVSPARFPTHSGMPWVDVVMPTPT